MAKNLATLVQDVVTARAMRDEAESTLKERVRVFEEAQETQALKLAMQEGDESLDKAQVALIEEMQKQKMKTFDGENGKATITTGLALIWGDDEKLIAYIEEYGTDEMKENVKTIKKLGKSAELKKTLKELLEIEKPKELEETGVHLEETISVKVTPRGNE